jgi:RHS repeat-associated protein
VSIHEDANAMSPFRTFVRSLPKKCLAISLSYTIATLGCHASVVLAAVAGVPDYQLPGMVRVPGGRVNAANGNLLIERSDIEVDTLLGTQSVAASYNSASGEWKWNFEVRYDGVEFVDSTGAVYHVGALADGSPVPGTVWLKRDNTTIETRGGLAYHFDSAGHIEHVRWSTLAYPRIRHVRSDAELLTLQQCTQANACSDLFEIELDENAPVVVEDSRTGRQVVYEYDAGRLVGVRDPVAIAQGQPGTRYEYHPIFPTLLTAIVNTENERIEYQYQANRRILNAVQIGEGNPTHRFVFQPPKNHTNDLYATTHTNPLGAKTRYLFDGLGRMRSVALVTTGEVATLDWSGLRPASVITASGAVTYLTYVDDSLVERTEASGNVVIVSYASGAINWLAPRYRPIARIEDTLGLVADFAYDSSGRLSAVTNGTGDTSSFTYNLGSAIETSTNPSGETSHFPLYGEHGHWRDRDGATPDHRALDAIGNIEVASVVRERGGFLLQNHDDNRNLIRLDLAATDTLGKITTTDAVAITRRGDGQIAYVARPSGADHSLLYDALGRLHTLSERVDGQWQATTFEHDLAGRPTAHTRPNGMRREFDYDGYGRITAQRALRGTTPQGEAIYAYANGQLASLYDSLRNTTEIYSYDSAGRLAMTTYGYGETLTREYDVRSRLIGERFDLLEPGLVADLGYEYDEADRRVRITDRLNQELLAESTFEHGRIVATETGNGLARSRSFDSNTGALVGFTTTDEQGNEVETTVIEYSAELNPPRRQIRTTTDTSLAVTEEQYWTGLGASLANPDQRVGKRVFGWNDGAGSSESFAYDELGNRVSDPSGNVFSYNAERNRLVSASLAASGQSHSYSYDEAGFVTIRDGIPLGWTATGRVASHGGDEFAWDMRGQLIAATVSGDERLFGWFGGRVSGNPEAGTLGALDLGAVVLQLGSGERLYRHLDFRGNVRFVTDDAGQVVNHYRYAPYEMDAAFGTGDNTVTFAGRAEVGALMILGFRIYDPAIGRFLSPDPIFQIVNQFAYTLGNPVAYQDADGLDTAETGAAVGGGIVFAAGIAATLAEGTIVTTVGAIGVGVSIGLGGLLLAFAIYVAIAEGQRDTAIVGGPELPSGSFVPSTSLAPGACGLLGIEVIPLLLVLLPPRVRRLRTRLCA